MATISDRIKEGMLIRNMKQADIIEKTGINKGALSSYLSGRYAPKQNNIYLIAKALNVNEAWLMGHDVPMKRINAFTQDLDTDRIMANDEGINTSKLLQENANMKGTQKAPDIDEMAEALRIFLCNKLGREPDEEELLRLEDFVDIFAQGLKERKKD